MFIFYDPKVGDIRIIFKEFVDSPVWNVCDNEDYFGSFELDWFPNYLANKLMLGYVVSYLPDRDEE